MVNGADLKLAAKEVAGDRSKRKLIVSCYYKIEEEVEANLLHNSSDLKVSSL